jgi:hypothetical protein
MITHPEKLQAAPELETMKIALASDEAARNLVGRAMRERWLSTVVRCLNRLEQKPMSRDLARRALQRLGFPTD